MNRFRVLLGAALFTVAAIPSAHAASPGCFAGTTHPRGDAHRVYAIPHGCAWIYRPDITAAYQPCGLAVVTD